MKCRTKKEISGAKGVILKNRKLATQGGCPTCETKMFRIGSIKLLTFSFACNSHGF
jgi:hypothetical protein